MQQGRGLAIVPCSVQSSIIGARKMEKPIWIPEIPVIPAATVDTLLAMVAVMSPAVHCKLCGQELTDPISIARGIGPICIEKGEGDVEL
jgi:hypothetical protein